MADRVKEADKLQKEVDRLTKQFLKVDWIKNSYLDVNLKHKEEYKDFNEKIESEFKEKEIAPELADPADFFLTAPTRKEIYLYQVVVQNIGTNEILSLHKEMTAKNDRVVNQWTVEFKKYCEGMNPHLKSPLLEKYHAEMLDFYDLEKPKYLIKIFKLALEEIKKDTFKVPGKVEVLDKSYLPVMQHNGLFDMMYHITKAGQGEKDFMETSTTLKTTGGGQLQLISDKEFPLEVLLKNLSDTQIQLVCYAIYLRQEQQKDKVTLNINDYFNLKGITRQKITVEKLIDDFRVLERMHFTFDAKVKGKPVPTHISKVLSVTDIYTRKNEVKFVFGDWFNSLSTAQYSLFNKQFFKYISSNKNPYIIKLSLKLNEIYRINLKSRKKKHSLKVANLIELLGFNENTIKAKGFVIACKDKIDNALDTIAEEEGYLWSYRKGDHATFADYKKDFIEFENPKMAEAYKQYTFKKLPAKR